MIIHVTYHLPGVPIPLEMEIVTKDKETHSWFADRPLLMKSIEEAVRSAIKTEIHKYTNVINDKLA